MACDSMRSQRSVTWNCPCVHSMSSYGICFCIANVLLCSGQLVLFAFPTHIPLQLMPEVISVWDSTAGEFNISPTVNISVAVATPNSLITPIVSNADQRTLPEIAALFKVRRGRQSSLRCGRIKCTYIQRDLVVPYCTCGVHGVPAMWGHCTWRWACGYAGILLVQ